MEFVFHQNLEGDQNSYEEEILPVIYRKDYYTENSVEKRNLRITELFNSRDEQQKNAGNNYYKNMRKNPNSLHNSLKSIISFIQYFGLFPVLGVNYPNSNGLTFRWFSKPVIYALGIIAYAVVHNLFNILKSLEDGLTYHNTTEFIFFADLILIYTLFINLARKWPRFANEWQNVESSNKLYGYPKNMATKFKLITIIFMILALMEHISAVSTKVMDAVECSHGNLDIIRAYFVNSYRIFSFIEYNVFVAFPIAIITLLMSCAWNCMDLFIVLLSIAMAQRYEQLNKLLKKIDRKPMPIIFWKRVRETYNKLSNLTKMLDDLLSPIVLLSFANNLYFICLQLLNSLKPMNSALHAMYFVYSFSYLVFRTFAVSIYAAAIYEQSQDPKSVLYSVPSESYCIEISRLLVQVTSDELALTGCRFFSVTRTLVLTVAGTIVTYEIVLVQFNAVSSDVKRNNTINCF